MTTEDKEGMISLEYKKQCVLNDISKNYSLIYDKYKPYYIHHYHTTDFDNYNEIISTKIIMPILEKLEKNEGKYTIDFYYEMFLKDKLKQYIFASVYRKLRFPNKEKESPLMFNNDIYKYDTSEPEDWIEKENFKDEVISEIYDMMRPERAKEVFGANNYQYYVEIIGLYLKHADIKYEDIEKKYGIRRMSYYYFRTWCLIRLELAKKGLYTPKSTLK